MIAASLAVAALAACKPDEADYTASIWQFYVPVTVKHFMWDDREVGLQILDISSAFRMRTPAGSEPGFGVMYADSSRDQDVFIRLVHTPPGIGSIALYFHSTLAQTSPYERGLDDAVISRACGGPQGEAALVHHHRNGRDVVVCRPPGYAGPTADILGDTLVISQAYVGHTVTRCEIRAVHPTKQQIEDLVDACSSVTASSCTTSYGRGYSDTTCD